MTIIFTFSNLPTSILDWILYAFLVSTYVFLVIEAFNLKRDERKFKIIKVLKITAIIFLVWYIVRSFIPSIEPYPPYQTPFEIFFTTFYDLFISIILFGGIFPIVLWIVFIIFGYKNREFYGSILISAGIISLVGWMLSNTVDIFNSSIFLIYSFPALNLLLEIMLWIVRSLFLFSAIIILIYSILIKRIFFILFSTFLLAAEIFSFYMFFAIP
ncbi:MAG: hypothetical protein ACFFBH_06195 [Promethearchaeota archaeon]